MTFMKDKQSESRPARFAEEYGFWPKEEEGVPSQSYAIHFGGGGSGGSMTKAEMEKLEAAFVTPRAGAVVTGEFEIPVGKLCVTEFSMPRDAIEDLLPRKRSWLEKKLMKGWRVFAAYFRLSQTAICEESIGKGEHTDYHDYPDSIIPEPFHGYRHTCKHCGKTFYI